MVQTLGRQVWIWRLPPDGRDLAAELGALTDAEEGEDGRVAWPRSEP